MTTDQTVRLILTSVFVVLLSMLKPRIKSWLASGDGRREKDPGSGPKA